MPRVLDNLISTTVNLGEKVIFACKPFNVSRLTANDDVLLDGFRREARLVLDRLIGA